MKKYNTYTFTTKWDVITVKLKGLTNDQLDDGYLIGLKNEAVFNEGYAKDSIAEILLKRDEVLSVEIGGVLLNNIYEK